MTLLVYVHQYNIWQWNNYICVEIIRNGVDLIMSEYPNKKYFRESIKSFSKKPCYNDIRKWALNVTSEATVLQFTLILIAVVPGRKPPTEY